MREYEKTIPGSLILTVGNYQSWLLSDQAGQWRDDLHCCSRHLPTLIGTLTTRLGTTLAVIHFMLLALGGTRITKVSTQLARLLCELRSTTHQSRRRPADLRTVPICFDAVCHLSDIRFAQARIGTMLAGLGTLYTSVNARTIFFLSHFTSPSTRTVGGTVHRNLRQTACQACNSQWLACQKGVE